MDTDLDLDLDEILSAPTAAERLNEARDRAAARRFGGLRYRKLRACAGCGVLWWAASNGRFCTAVCRLRAWRAARAAELSASGEVPVLKYRTS